MRPHRRNCTTHSPTITIAGTASDASGIASVTVHYEPLRGEYADAADVSRDGRVTSLDALMLLQAAGGGGVET